MVEPGPERVAGRAGQGYHPLLAPLAEHADVASVHVDVAHVEPDELPDAQPGAVEEFEQGAVAQVRGRRARYRDRLDERLAVVDGERPRQPLRRARQRHARRGIETAIPLAHQEAEKRTNRGELARQRRRIAAAVQRRQETAHVLRCHMVRPGPGFERCRELAHVRSVGAAGVRRKVALRAQVQVEAAQAFLEAGGAHRLLQTRSTSQGQRAGTTLGAVSPVPHLSSQR